MKIGIVANPTLGGSGIAASCVGYELSKVGHEVFFFSFEKPFKRDVLELVEFHRVPLKRYHAIKVPPILLLTASKAAEIAMNRGIQVLNAHYAIPHATSAYLAKQMCRSKNYELPFVTTCHGTDVHGIGLSKPYKEGVGFVLNASDAVVAVSKYLADIIHKKIGVKEDKIKVIYNFVDAHKFNRKTAFDPALRSKFAASDEKIIIHVSNMRPIKRVPDVIDVFNMVQRDINAKLLLVGTGPAIPKVKGKVKALGIGKKVFFLGSRSDTERLYSISDVLILPSRREGMSLAVLESCACETPPVTYRVGGLPEAIEHGVTGVMTPFCNIEKMAEHVLGILSDPEKRRKMGIAARNKMIEEFSPQKAVSEYVKLYSEIVPC
jgi:N-acetyl-alpha-D-glucosaminyl L-malate synthase BshA